MKIGDYVRTKYGHICKIVNINNFKEPSMSYCVEANYLNDIQFIGKEEIYKSSRSIKGLIEVGDYINGYRVSCISGVTKNIYTDDINIYFKEEEDIKSIVTKEQFERMEYKI